jgi:hypothetical protein
MDGPSHYTKAQDQLGLANDTYISAGGPDDHWFDLAMAQVHATLALADFFRAWVEAQS